MDVQAATPTPPSTTSTLPPPLTTVAASSLPPAPAAPGTPAAVSSGPASGANADPTPGLALLPPPGATPPPSNGTPSLPNNVAKLYGTPADTTSVSFQPAAGSNEIVTVVTDTQTGKVIVQFPSETLVALAQFFQKLDTTTADNGAVLDKKV